jgi:hypothetical protein
MTHCQFSGRNGEQLWIVFWYRPITVAARSKAWTVFARSNAGIVGLNPTRHMDVCVCLFYVSVVLCVDSGLATGWSPTQGVRPTVYKINKLKKRPRSNNYYGIMFSLWDFLKLRNYYSRISSSFWDTILSWTLATFECWKVFSFGLRCSRHHTVN